ncbi:MAG: methylenetetrahydrofolate reductase [NAD(P)H] [Ignavibacteria bacterium]|jgi:methylenetetrahydrofolate reductase (NADPH)|nr:methylenetetrahydrofolate reductase [NAD(P)H] [Ignavibacteria bacterium]MCU7503668.1 methylenetetrahydrofolate reductase [NAD(P)H] [Ignavibacteria bacterium]MCU7518479.1 methylenetetrahydrofolate reductase [NAD(P)H] [Ignavibacteria bacterium]
MKVIEHLAIRKGPLISFEIIPPQRGGDIKALLSVIEHIAKYHPPFIDITSHAAEVIYEETPGGIQRRVKRKRPGTLGICALIQNKYNIDAVPHIICQGFTREETEDFLIELHYLGIDNVLAIRGDENTFKKPLAYGRSANTYASELVSQIVAMNHGRYLEEGLLDAKPTNFCVGVGGYPEKHFEAPNMKIDIKHTKQKVDAGAEYIVTQMFFDNQKYFNYVDCCRLEGIDVPIIPGLKIITTKTQLTNIPRNFYIDIPDELSEEVLSAKPEHVMEIGVNWACKQVEELLNRNVPGVHFYIMQNSKPILMLLEKLKF